MNTTKETINEDTFSCNDNTNWIESGTIDQQFGEWWQLKFKKFDNMGNIQDINKAFKS